MNFHDVQLVIKRGDVTKLRAELECGLDPNLCNRNSYTILMIAAGNGNTAIGRLLIEKDADLDSRSKNRETALSIAVQAGQPSFVRLLLASGASLNCHPHGNSLDIFLEWAEQYTDAKACAEHIKQLFTEELKARTGSPPSSA
jgi:ankyrin repeat protein